MAYLDYRLGDRLDTSAICKYVKIDGRTRIYFICKNEEQATAFYQILKPNENRGVFSEIIKKEGFRTDGRKITYSNDRPYHNQLVRAVRSWLLYNIENHPPQ